MSTSLAKIRCTGCEHLVFKSTMRVLHGKLYCVECFVLKSSTRNFAGQERKRMQNQRMETRRTVGVKYGSADQVAIRGEKAVISDKPLKDTEAEKIAADGAVTGKKKVVVTDKDHRRTDEDHIPGD